MAAQLPNGDLSAWLNGRPVRTVWLALITAGAGLVAVDRLVPELGLGPLYIPLIAIAGWRFGLRASLTVALVACLLNVFPHHVEEAVPPAIAAARAAMRVGTYGFVCGVIEVLRRSHRREMQLARTDGLTGLLNRKAFDDDGARAIRDEPSCCWLLAVIDVDTFKLVNDRHGHLAGDQVLQALAAALPKIAGPGGFVGRIGGDEFAVLQPARSIADGHTLAKRLSASLAAALNDAVSQPTASVGTIVFPAAEQLSWPELMAAADADMYVAKTSRSWRGSDDKAAGGRRPGVSDLVA